MKKILVFLFLILQILILPFRNIEASTFTITGSSSFAGTVSVAMPINDIQITGGSAGDTVPVKLRVTSGTLTMSTTTGLTFTGSSSGSTLQFTGTRTNVNNALATLTYTRGSTGTDTLEISLVNPGEVFFEDNGHLYEYISYTGTWDQAKTHAETLTRYGASGYLVTVTSDAENEFVRARLSNAGWMGASDSASEGVWRWVTGPEAGTQFWQGASGGTTVGGNYANWGTGEPNDYQNGNPGEDCAQFLTGGTGKWNDLPCASQGGQTLPGYVAEFGAPGNMPTVEAKNVSITTSSLPIISTVSPLDNAVNVNPSSNLVINFSKTVYTESGNITIYKTSDNSITEAIPANDARVTGSGSSTITINPTSNLSDSTSYYIHIANDAFRDSLNNYFAGINNATTWNFTTGDFTGPTISQVTPVISPTNDSTPSYTFTTNESGSISYGGSCSSATTSAISGNNTISFNSLADGTYSNCTIVVTDSALNTSNTLSVSSFTVDTIAPTLTTTSQIQSTINTTNANFSFSTTESGTYTISSCGYSSSASASGNSVILNNLESGKTYSCNIYSTDSAGNVSNTLTIGPFTVSIGGAVPVAILQAMSEEMRRKENEVKTQNNSDILTKNTNIKEENKKTNTNLFLVDMNRGDKNNEVKRLQQFLKDFNKDIYPEGIVSGFYGPLTQRAVIRFQERFSEEILAPIGTTRGTGFAGTYTRSKINSIIQENQVVYSIY